MLGIGALVGLGTKLLRPGGAKEILGTAKKIGGIIGGLFGRKKRKGAGGGVKGAMASAPMNTVLTNQTLYSAANTDAKARKMSGGYDNSDEKGDKMSGDGYGRDKGEKMGGGSDLGGGGMSSKTKDMLTWGGIGLAGLLVVGLIMKKK